MNAHYWMQQAIDLAARERHTAPNPRVGAVVVWEGTLVSTGVHKRAGEEHAEVHALREAVAKGAKLQDCTIFVTLEPCSHVGRTGSCAKMLCDAGVGKVVVGCRDPNPVVAGSGIQMLRDAGIEVEVGVLEDQCVDLISDFETWLANQPFGALKVAQTLDGAASDAYGVSQWITGDKAREKVHDLRRHYGVVVSGMGTLLADDPALTVRLDGVAPDDLTQQPIAVFLAKELTAAPQKLKIYERKQRTLLVCESQGEWADSWQHFGVEVVELEGYWSGPARLQSYLHSLGSRFLVEAGPKVAQWALDHKLVQYAHYFIAPKLLHSAGLPWASSAAGNHLADATQIRPVLIDQHGQDVELRGRLNYCGDSKG